MSDDIKLSGKVALVTGAARGLGCAIASALWNEGAEVIAVDRLADELASLKALFPKRFETWAEDITSDAFLDRISKLSQLHILVNNAGTNRPQPFTKVTDDALDLMLALNVRATFRISRTAVAKMREGACIVNITSQMGHVGSPNRSVYCMTKHAIEGLTKAMAVELGPQGIRVNSVAPTFVETPMTKIMFEDRNFFEFVIKSIPMGHLASTDDVAAAVIYLCSKSGRMVTGHSLLVDGGWTAQ